jgi:hypothetical protein
LFKERSSILTKTFTLTSPQRLHQIATPTENKVDVKAMRQIEPVEFKRPPNAGANEGM